MNSIFPFFRWVDSTSLNKLINDSTWLFPAIEGVHIVALALLFGAVIVLNLRMLGVLMKGRQLPRLLKELQPWTFWSLAVILFSGLLLFSAEAVKSFYSTPFRIKIVVLVLALLFHFGISSSLMRRDDAARPAWSKAAAVLAIAMWTTVGFAGRAIGFF
jgi:hypothetical protein